METSKNNKNKVSLNKNKVLWVYLISIFFIIGNIYFVYKGNYFFSLIPIIIIVAIFAFLAMDKLLLAVVFLVPLSVPLREYFPNLPFDMFIPTEPIIVGIMFIFILKLILDNNIDKRILKHPISIAIYFNLIWMFITSLTSTMPIVSIKFFLVRMWFVSAFYFIAIMLFKKRENIYRYIWLYILSLIIVIFYTEYRHLDYGLLDQKAANFVCSPFYNDHTSYGAAIAFVFPVLIGFLLSKRYKPLVKIAIFIVFAIISAGLVLSYTRAAWLSLIVATMVLIVVLLKIKFRTIFLITAVLIGLFFSFKTQIFMYLEHNKQDASSNFSEQLTSMTNIVSDASNLERLNRWDSALRMFKEKPFFGFGPGTYMFQYAPYQMSYEKTIISTNAGDGGNAHSEYIGALAESGVLGTITYVLIIIATLYTALMMYSRSRSRELKIILLSVTLGLITYYVHGFLNNFLDTDKISALFWGYTAIIVALEIFHQKDMEKEYLESEKHKQD